MDEDSMYYDDENGTSCEYLGTEFIEGKIYLIGVFATTIAILSIVFNTFFTIVFLSKRSIRKSSVFYFGILAVLDTIMAFNYLAVMSLPVNKIINESPILFKTSTVRCSQRSQNKTFREMNAHVDRSTYVNSKKTYANYCFLMQLVDKYFQVYMDYYQYVPVYHVFLSYFRLILTESNWAIFSSMLLILLATTERLLRTFDGEKVLKLRRFLERHRPSVSLLCILIAVPYKACVYWEISVSYKPQCESEFSKYEIVAGPFALIPEYNFWWMFITRNVVDRILPFFILVAMNYTIFMTLKKDYKRSDGKSSIHEKNGISLATNRRSLRDATRALISIVSMYLMSQFPQVLLTFWETFDKESLVQLNEFYSYLNDILSILTLLSSCLRFPVYCSCNHLIYTSSKDTLSEISGMFFQEDKTTKVYEPISSTEKNCSSIIDKNTQSSESELTKVPGVIYNDKLNEWQL